MLDYWLPSEISKCVVRRRLLFMLMLIQYFVPHFSSYVFLGILVACLFESGGLPPEDDGTLISAKLRFNIVNSDLAYCRVEIDGEECASCSWDSCPLDSKPIHGFTADCANLGYGGNTSSCGSDDSAGGMLRFLTSNFMKSCRSSIS